MKKTTLGLGTPDTAGHHFPRRSFRQAPQGHERTAPGCRHGTGKPAAGHRPPLHRRQPLATRKPITASAACWPAAPRDPRNARSANAYLAMAMRLATSRPPVTTTSGSAMPPGTCGGSEAVAVELPWYAPAPLRSGALPGQTVRPSKAGRHDPPGRPASQSGTPARPGHRHRRIQSEQHRRLSPSRRRASCSSFPKPRPASA